MTNTFFFESLFCFLIVSKPQHSAIPEIRQFFFRAHQAKMVNCMPASGAAQHIEAPIITNNNLPAS